MTSSETMTETGKDDGTQCLAHSKMFDKSTPYVLENDWKSVANSQRRYVFTVLYTISQKIIGIH